jgi:hypothetical protein
VNWRAIIYSAIEALEAGDVRLCETILAGALEDASPVARRYGCPLCGAAFEWPGLLDDHRRFTHWRAAA